LTFSTHYPYSLAELATIAAGIEPFGSTIVINVVLVPYSVLSNIHPAIRSSPLTESFIGGNSGTSSDFATTTHLLSSRNTLDTKTKSLDFTTILIVLNL
jgi:hypothetical protein